MYWNVAGMLLRIRRLLHWAKYSQDRGHLHALSSSVILPCYGLVGGPTNWKKVVETMSARTVADFLGKMPHEL